MPTYQYRCTSCGDELEVVQKFTDPALTECPACTGALRKVYNAVGVVFKGSGFYRTDSRTAPSDGGGEGKADAKPDGAKGNGNGSRNEPKPAGDREKPGMAEKSGKEAKPAAAAPKATAGSGSSSSTGS